MIELPSEEVITKLMLKGYDVCNEVYDNGIFWRILHRLYIFKPWVRSHDWEFDLNLYNPLSWIVIVIFGIIILFVNDYTIKEFKHDIWIDRCPDKRLYYNKKNVEYYKRKSMAYL